MAKRVLVLLACSVVAFVLRQMGVPRFLALAIAFAPFAILEAKGLLSPYEPTTSDILHGEDSAGPAAHPSDRNQAGR